MSKTLFAECYLNHNLGDDLFLTTLSHRYPDVDILVAATPDYEPLLDSLPNVRNIATPSKKPDTATGKALVLKNKLAVARDANCFVSIGGSIFIEPSASNTIKSFSSCHIKETKDSLLLKSNKHSFVIGANFGPYTTSSFLSFYQKLFRHHCDDICFRDQASFALFKDLKNARVAPDLLFSTKFPKVNKTNTALFSIVHLGYRQKFGSLSNVNQQYLSWMLEAAKSCYTIGLTPVVTSFSSPEQDTFGSEQFCSLLEAEGIPYKKCDYYNNPNTLLSVIASSSLVVGTRLHATVLGLAAGIPVLPIIYSNKTLNMLTDCGFDLQNVLDLRQLGSAAIPSANELVTRAIKIGAFDVSEQITHSHEHFNALDLYLS